MKCPKCGEEMEKGVLLGSNGSRWQKGVVEKFVKMFNFVSGPFVYAWRCSKCGKVELDSEVK